MKIRVLHEKCKIMRLTCQANDNFKKKPKCMTICFNYNDLISCRLILFDKNLIKLIITKNSSNDIKYLCAPFSWRLFLGFEKFYAILPPYVLTLPQNILPIRYSLWALIEIGGTKLV